LYPKGFDFSVARSTVQPMAHAILTAIGVDRAGLVDEVSRYIFDRGGNIEDSRMVNLRGQFAMMLLISGDASVMARIGDEQSRLEELSGLHVDVRQSPEPPRAASPAAASQAMSFQFVATAVDRAGIVHRLSHLLRELGVNIESLETRLTAAPYTGAPVFEVEAVLSVPRGTPVSQLRQKLGALGDELNMDWELRPA
jgi:glycine cleavage system transcriptional repressor